MADCILKTEIGRQWITRKTALYKIDDLKFTIFDSIKEGKPSLKQTQSDSVYQRTHQEDMMAKSMAEKSTGLVRLVEERALSKREEKKREQENFVPYIPNACISNILVRLPLESLQRSKFVFVKERFYPYSVEKPNTFSVEANVVQSQLELLFKRTFIDSRLKFYIQFMEIRDGKSKIGELNATCLGEIRATCNGLILLDNNLKKGGLIVTNPVTRKVTVLPLGTLYPPHDESYGLALCSSTKKYKVVHLFRDEMQYIGCEILILGTRSWKVVDGPSFGLMRWFGYKPVSAIGALHWVPDIDRSEYIISMEMENEKFHKIALPKSSRSYDGIVEMGGLLCFVIHEEHQIDVWILRSLCGEDWTKQHSITVGYIIDIVPLYCSRIKGEMVFKDKDGSLYAYDFQLQVMKKVEMKKGFPIHGCYLPHVNSLVSWQTEEEGQDLDD
ncbi:hypothetical protein F0562_028341 [Nyssa sinensis]|uniref:F-box associated beta-propeller type 3 domain-containing protein n=1 Tax=Nyssa sinensis TaxID=561372 RepID=A0A5J5B842_9ASTE|nr:hypothetical protein F0562_028341 [Nyssa sinensis]